MVRRVRERSAQAALRAHRHDSYARRSDLEAVCEFGFPRLCGGLRRDRRGGGATRRTGGDRHGITLSDTAESYGPYISEELLGKALCSRRKEIVLVTNVGFRYEGNRLVNQPTAPSASASSLAVSYSCAGCVLTARMLEIGVPVGASHVTTLFTPGPPDSTTARGTRGSPGPPAQILRPIACATPGYPRAGTDARRERLMQKELGAESIPSRGHFRRHHIASP